MESKPVDGAYYPYQYGGTQQPPQQQYQYQPYSEPQQYPPPPQYSATQSQYTQVTQQYVYGAVPAVPGTVVLTNQVVNRPSAIAATILMVLGLCSMVVFIGLYLDCVLSYTCYYSQLTTAYVFISIAFVFFILSAILRYNRYSYETRVVV